MLKYVHTFYLFQNEEIAMKYRPQIWKQLLQIDTVNVNYPLMKTEVALRMENSVVEDIIALDLNR